METDERMQRQALRRLSEAAASLPSDVLSDISLTRFHAAANPTAILALLDELDATETALWECEQGEDA